MSELSSPKSSNLVIFASAFFFVKGAILLLIGLFFLIFFFDKVDLQLQEATHFVSSTSGQDRRYDMYSSKQKAGSDLSILSLELIDFSFEHNSPSKVQQNINKLPASTISWFQHYEPAGCKRPPDDYSLINVGEATINMRTYAMLEYAAGIYDGPIDLLGSAITQGVYENNRSHNLDTYQDAGVVDISVMSSGGSEVLYEEIDPLLKALRVAGFAAWLRDWNEVYPGSEIHIHAVAIGDRELSEESVEQLTGKFGYFRGYRGLPGPNREIDRYGAPLICQWMLDEGGRAFTVKNQNTEECYRISELMIYDPNDPGEGFFYEFTDQINMDIGITGFGGFQLWRPISPIEDKSPEQLTFNGAMEAIFEEFGGDWHVIFREVDGEVIYSWHARERIHPASTIKVLIAMLFFEAFDDEMPRNLQEYLAERGTGGRTYEQLLRAMLVVSEEDATEILVEWIEERMRIRDSLERWGLTDTTINPRRTTAEETARILEGLYQGMWIEPQARDFILELMGEYTSSDDGRLGVIRDQLLNVNIYNKRGSLAREWVIVADTAIIE